MTISDMNIGHEVVDVAEEDPVNTVKREWGRMIREQRCALGKSQAWLADQIGVDQSAVSYWEHGRRAPSVEKQLAIAKALGVAPRVLFQFPVAS